MGDEVESKRRSKHASKVQKQCMVTESTSAYSSLPRNYWGHPGLPQNPCFCMPMHSVAYKLMCRRVGWNERYFLLDSGQRHAGIKFLVKVGRPTFDSTRSQADVFLLTNIANVVRNVHSLVEGRKCFSHHLPGLLHLRRNIRTSTRLDCKLTP